MTCIGCDRKVVLHPITTQDIIRVPKGQTITAPKDGYFLSDMYVNKVMQTKVEK